MAFHRSRCSRARPCVSIPLSILAHRRAGAADRRDKERHELALAEAAASQQVELSLEPQATWGIDASEPRVLVRNIGRGTARNVSAWLVDDDEPRSRAVTERIVTLAPTHDPVEVRVRVEAAAWNEAEVHLLRWRVAWTDGNGPHEETTDWRPPPDPEVVDIY